MDVWGAKSRRSSGEGGGGSGIIERSEEWSCPGNTEQEEGRTTASVQLPCLLLLLCHNTVSVRR